MLHVRTLGKCSITLDGRTLDFGRLKDRALLTFLVLSRERDFTRDYLSELLWSGPSRARSRHSLSQALYTIRRVAPECIVVDGEVIRFGNLPATIDLDQIRQFIRKGAYEKAQTLLRGTFLADYAAIVSDPFQEWVEQSHLDYGTQLTAELRSVKLHAASNAPATEFLIAARQIFPSIEVHDLGVEVQDVPITKFVRDGRQEPLAKSESKRSFVGRAAELNALSNAVEDVLRGEHKYIVVCGKPGFGKSALFNEFERGLNGRVRSLRISCREGEKRIGYAVLSQLIASVDHATLQRMEPVWLNSLMQLTWNRGAQDTTPPLGAAASQARLFEAVRQLVTKIASELPIALLLDDVQWCDRSSREAITFLQNRLNAPVLILAASRVDARNMPSPGPWARWGRIDVNEFTKDEIVELLKEYAPARAKDASDILKSTGGHPFFVTELLRTPNQDGAVTLGQPGRLGSFLSAILSSLPPKCQAIVTALSVIGEPTSPKVLAHVLRRHNIAPQLDQLVAKGLIKIEGTQVYLAHDIIREAAYSRIPGFTKSHLHGEVGRILPNSPQWAGKRAEHLLKSGDREAAFRCAVSAAKEAQNNRTHAEAAYFLRLAIHAKPASARRLKPHLVKQLQAGHRLKEARSELAAYLQSWPGRVTDDLRVLDSELGYALGEIDPAQVTGCLLRSLSEDVTAAVLVRALVLCNRVAFHAGDNEEGARLSTRLRDVAMQLPARSSTRLEALAHAIRMHCSFTSASQANVWSREIEDNVGAIPEHDVRIQVMTSIGIIKYESGCLQEAKKWLTLAAEHIDAVGAVQKWPIVTAHLHMLSVEIGDYHAAHAFENLFNEKRALLEGVEFTLTQLKANAALMRLDQGDAAAALQLAQEARSFGLPSTAVWVELGTYGVEGLARLELGDVMGAKKAEDILRRRILPTQAMLGDVSQNAILRARVLAIEKNPSGAIQLLADAVQAYADRDTICRLRMQLELARLLRTVDRTQARAHAKEVYETARSIGARPLAERADSLLMRI